MGKAFSLCSSEPDYGMHCHQQHVCQFYILAQSWDPDWLSHCIYNRTQGSKRGLSLFQYCQIPQSYKMDPKQNLSFWGQTEKKKKKQLTLALTFICQINKNEVCRSAPYLLSLIPLFPLFPSCSFYCLRLIDDYFRESKPAQSLKNLARNCYCDSIFQTLLC